MARLAQGKAPGFGGERDHQLPTRWSLIFCRELAGFRAAGFSYRFALSWSPSATSAVGRGRGLMGRRFRRAAAVPPAWLAMRLDAIISSAVDRLIVLVQCATRHMAKPVGLVGRAPPCTPGTTILKCWRRQLSTFDETVREGGLPEMLGDFLLRRAAVHTF